MRDLIVPLTLRLAVLVAACAIVALVRRRGPSAERHGLWMLTLGASLVMPIAMAIVPALRVIPVGRVRAESSPSFAATPGTPATMSIAAGPAGPRPDVGAARYTPVERPTLDQLLLGLWVAGAIICLIRLARAHRDARRIVRRAAEEPPLSLGGAHPVLVSEDAASPFSYGLRDPVVVLPRAAATWPPERLRATLLHEQAHVARRDGLALLFAQCAAAVYWWHPAIWYAARMAAAERERACDDAVLREGIRPSEYGSHLLVHAMGSESWRGRPLAAALFSHSEGLAARIASLLDPRVDRGVFGRRRALAAGGLAVMVTALVAAAAPARRETRPPAPLLQQGATESNACAQADPREARTARFDSAGVMITGAGSFVDGAGMTRLIWTGTDCIAWVAFRGAPEITSDGREVMIGPKTNFVAHQERDTTIRQFTVTIASGPVFTVNRRPTAPDVADREWIAEMVREYIRRSGHDAPRRSRAIVERAGVDGLLAEVRRIHVARVRAIYLLAGYPHVQGEAAHARFIRDGGSLLDGMSKAGFLAGVPSAWRQELPVLAAVYIEAAGMEEDDEVEAILRAFPPTRPAPPELRQPLESLIATLSTTERRSALRAYYLDVRP